jgi:hypothetical protein
VLHQTRDLSKGKALFNCDVFIGDETPRAMRLGATSKIKDLNYDTMSTGCGFAAVARVMRTA